MQSFVVVFYASCFLLSVLWLSEKPFCFVEAEKLSMNAKQVSPEYHHTTCDKYLLSNVK